MKQKEKVAAIIAALKAQYPERGVRAAIQKGL